jgi:hypothetical protein
MATINAINTTIPIPVASGGTGASSLTANRLLLGNGTSAVSALGAATNGQIPIGSTGSSPVLATITAGSGISVTNGAGTISIAATGGSGISTITGNSGGALSGSNINIVTANATAKVAGASTTETIDFGIDNLCLGSSLPSLSTGVHNVGFGIDALSALSTGNSNTAIGYNALKATNTATAGGNTAVGKSALLAQAGGSGNNTALGIFAGYLITTGSYNTYIGSNAGGSNTGSDSSNINIGYNTVTANGTSNELRIGNGTGTGSGSVNKCFVCGINGIVVTGVNVLVSSSNQLGVASSSARYKHDIKDMASDTDDVYKLRPVTFLWNKDSAPGLSDAPSDRQFGLIAEEVSTVMPHIVYYDSEGLVQGVQYEKLIPMLLNEIQRLEKRVTQLESK